ncbi:MAG TPA: HEAT repeat domain-containing protein [Chryseolinea sp.]|nr:HEAT repeat domain-containing protein [Chryseolinea sp.]HPM32607.1 HEAT repeat domain-containing protein [Chryseolinea sp.]
MDLRKEILKEHSKTQAHKLADYVGDSTSRFKQLVDVYLAGPYRVTQRSAWPLGIIAEHHPDLIIPHLKKLIDFLSKPGIHDSVKRNTMRILQFIDIPKKNYGQVTELCFEYLQSRKEPIAVKVFSMTVLSKIIKDEPDLRNELKMIIEDQMPYATGAFTSRGRKVLKEIDMVSKGTVKRSL